jgi:NAD(P)-dependent dehydrogenase (short-subunit alcohol dehydrogenase family)
LIVEPIRRRGAGDIVLVCRPIGRASEGAAALRAYGAALRKQLHTTGVRVAVAAPGGVATRLAARLREPRLTAIGADAVAESVLRGLRSRRAAIATPGIATLAPRILRLLLTRLAETGRTLLAPADPLPDPSDETPLVGKSAPGD